MDTRKEILTALNKHAKIDLHELSLTTGMNETELANEIAQMEKERIISGYYALIDWEKAGDQRVEALIEVRVSPQRNTGFDRVAERISRYPEVDAVYLISGGYDILVMLQGKTMQEIAAFVYEKLASIDAVYSTATHFILRKYKEHETILTVSGKAERMKVTP